MAKWIAAYNEEDVPYGDEIRIRIEGVETGFVAVPENGEDLGLYPVDTEEEAREDLAISWPVSAPSTGWTRTELRTRENSVRGRAATLRGARMQTSQLELFDSFDSPGKRGRAAALPLFLE